MSAGTSQVAVLGARGRLSTTHDRSRSGTGLLSFGALALYGALKWSTLLLGGELARLLGLLVLAMLLAAGRPWLARRSRLLAAAATFLVLVAVFPLAGVPLAWVTHLRIAVTASAIGQGLSTLPQVLVPYSGANQWVSMVIVLGAGVLLFDAALLLAFAPGPLEDLRRAGAALPLIALAAVPTTLVRPRIPYVDGLVLFALLVAFVWGGRIGRRRAGGAIWLCAIAAAAALFAAPALDQHKPWFNYRALGGGVGPTVVESFDWSQGYGPLDWPRRGRPVLEIQAAHPEYWKAENLDTFNGVGWTQGAVQGAAQLPAPDPSARRRWTQTIGVTVRNMRIPQVIGAGTSEAPVNLPQGATHGLSPGTWTSGSGLGPGDSYRLSVYVPSPGPGELNSAGAGYARVPRGYLTVELPPSNGSPSPDEVYMYGERPAGYQGQLVFGAFHTGQPLRAVGAPSQISAESLLNSSDNVGRFSLLNVYRLAQRLAAGAATPYGFAEAVESYLARGYAYDESPPPSLYPLVSFLFASHRGYCQQFAGAMALLLRMGGVPARVAVGFTSGHESGTNTWLVTDYDAHAWVEVWFPHYGWVTFDPTPGADPARKDQPPIVAGGGTDLAATGVGLFASKTHSRFTGRGHHGAARRRGAVHQSAAAGGEPSWIAAPIAAALLALVVLLLSRPLRSVEALVAELEGALMRIGRPLPAGATLTWLERRVGRSEDAAAYVRALRLARFGDADTLPTVAQRRALRRQLCLGRGPFGMLRAIWALPPRWSPPKRAVVSRTRTRRGPGA